MRNLPHEPIALLALVFILFFLTAIMAMRKHKHISIALTALLCLGSVLPALVIAWIITSFVPVFGAMRSSPLPPDVATVSTAVASPTPSPMPTGLSSTPTPTLPASSVVTMPPYAAGEQWVALPMPKECGGDGSAYQANQHILQRTCHVLAGLALDVRWPVEANVVRGSPTLNRCTVQGNELVVSGPHPGLSAEIVLPSYHNGCETASTATLHIWGTPALGTDMNLLFKIKFTFCSADVGGGNIITWNSRKCHADDTEINYNTSYRIIVEPTP
jgi:hypothetical protein